MGKLVRDPEGRKVEAAIRAKGGEASYVHLDVTSEADDSSYVAGSELVVDGGTLAQ